VQFESATIPIEKETKSNLDLISKMDSDARKMRKSSSSAPAESDVNVRKAVRFASKGKGSAAFAKDDKKRKGGKGRK
jgi:regulator of ribosome biosynthesis